MACVARVVVHFLSGGQNSFNVRLERCENQATCNTPYLCSQLWLSHIKIGYVTPTFPHLFIFSRLWMILSLQISNRHDECLRADGQTELLYILVNTDRSIWDHPLRTSTKFLGVMTHLPPFCANLCNLPYWRLLLGSPPSPSLRTSFMDGPYANVYERYEFAITGGVRAPLRPPMPRA